MLQNRRVHDTGIIRGLIEVLKDFQEAEKQFAKHFKVFLITKGRIEELLNTKIGIDSEIQILDQQLNNLIIMISKLDKIRLS